MKTKIVIGFLVFLIFVLALFLRVYFPWDSVFQDPIRYAADDGVYHMRIVENLLLGGHYPNKIYFDPFTYFPYGTFIHFAPLYDQLLAGIIWTASLGQPTLELINKIAPFYPAVLGSLVTIVIYFIGKVLWGSLAGLFSAFLIALFRSLLGATDHHQAEVLFSSLAILFLILAFKYHLIKKKFLLFTILAGFGLGLYFLTWNGALLFLFIIFISIILYYLIEYLRGILQNWILLMGSGVFLITLAMISPFFGHPDLLHSPLYNIDHLGALLLGTFGFLFVFWLGKILKKKKVDKIYFPGILALAGIIILFIIQIAFPPLSQGIIESFKTINVGITPQMGEVEWRGAARETIGEMSPMSIQDAFNSFGCFFYFAFIALGFIIYNFIKKRKPEELLIVLWFLVIVSITGVFISAIGQNRFNYYLAVIISLLSGFLIIKAIKFAILGIKVSRENNQKIHLRVGSSILIFNIIFFVFFPFPLNLINPFPENLPKIIIDAVNTAKFGTGGQHQNWYETLKWLKENTPDPGLDYYALYEEPKFNPKTGKIEPYPYPETAYGIMSSWDVGHIITYYAHRYPNANQFQQGLGRIDENLGIVVPGEAVFFIENEEQKAIEYLEKLKTKYIITDFGGADKYGSFSGKTKWALGNLGGYYFEEGEEKGVSTRKYDKSIIIRLHYFDGREWQYQEEKKSYIKYLDHFRLVYESETPVSPPFFIEEKDDEKNNIRLVKIFEYVKGAKIQGWAPTGTKIEISTNIKTNQGREFVYKKTIEVVDWRFEFIVPYSTFGKDGWIEGGTKFEVFASPYKLKIGDKEKEIMVSEKDILEGRIIVAE